MPVVQMPDGTSVNMPDQIDAATAQRLRAFHTASMGANTTPYKATPDTISPNPSTFAGRVLGSAFPFSPLVQLAHTIATGKSIPAPIGGDQTPENLRNAAQAGVDTKTGAPNGNVAAAFAPDVQTQQKVYQAKNPGVPTRIGPQSGQVEYLNKSTNRWTLAQPNVIESAVPEAIQGAGQIVGALGGTALGGFAGGPAGAVIGSIGGSGAGSAGGKLATNAIGKAVGALPSDMPLSQGTGSAAAVGAATDLGGQATLGIAKYLRYIWKGKRFFTDADAQLLVNAQKRASALIDKIRAGSGMSFNPDMAQVAADPSSGISATEPAQKAIMARRFASGNDISQVQVAQNQAQSDAALKGYFDNILVQHQLQGLNPQQAAQNVAQGLTNPFHVAQAAARDAISKLPPDAQREQAATITRAALQSAHDSFHQTIEKPAYDAYNKAIGFDPITHSSNIQVPWTQDVRDLMTGWSAEERKALVGLVGQDSGRLTVNFGEGTPDVFSQVLDKDGSPFLLKKGEPAQGADLADVDSAVKWLRQNARTGMSGKQGVVLPTAKLNKLAGAMADMRNSFLEENHPDIKGLLDVAEGTSREKAGRFGTGLLDTILTNGGDGSPRLTDLEALDKVMGTPDQATLKPVTDIIKGNPQAKDQLNQYLLARYRQEVVNPDTGIPSVVAHNRFMKQYGPFIQNVFDAKDLPEINQVGGLARAVVTETKNLKAFMPRMFSNPDGSVEALNPNKIVTNMFGSGASLDNANRMIATMKRYQYSSNAFEQWRAATADYLHSQMVRGGQFVPGKLSAFLEANNGQNAAIIEKIFNTDGALGGTKLVNGLKTLNQGAQLARDVTMGGSNPDQTTLLQRALRTYFHPFSEEGRVMDFLKRERIRENPSVLYDLLTNPDKMQYAAGQTKRTMKAIRNIGVGVGVGDAVREYVDQRSAVGSSIPQQKQQGQGVNSSY